MKRLLLTIILATMALLTANAQGRIYCELIGTQKLLSTKYNVHVDFGQQTHLFSDNRLVDEKGKVIEFNTMVDAMNFMSSMGWEFEQAYVVTLGSDSSATHVFHWLLSKYVGQGGDPNTLKTKDILVQEQRVAELVHQAESNVPAE